VSVSPAGFAKKNAAVVVLTPTCHLGTLFAYQATVNNYLGASYSVVGYKKKIVVFAITLALGGGTLLAYSAQTTDTELKKKSNSSYSLSETDPNYSGRGIDTWELFRKMMAAVLIVVVLGAAAIYVSRKFLPKITNLPGKKIHIVETVYLGPRKAVHLLKIGNQQLLVGSTNEGITALADVTDALADLSPQEAEDDSRGHK